ncbi:MAG: FeoA family protein [Bacilli bacterium]|nr:FeoA family protein [Bacilli bacterium]MDD4607925.1 FeoA family protein [Bacilli bacterium]
MRLNDLNLGAKGMVKKLNISGKQKQRLLDIGLTEGTVIESVLRSPSGDPTAYYIRGALIAIRKEDSCNIMCDVI